MQNDITFASAVSRIVDNARRLSTPAQAVALALDLTCPQPEAEWHAICPWCLGERKAAVFRLSFDRDRSAGDCLSCSYTGPDTLVAAVSL